MHYKGLIFTCLIIFFFSPIRAQEDNHPISGTKALTQQEKYDAFIKLLKKDCTCGLITGFLWGTSFGGISVPLDIAGNFFYTLTWGQYHDSGDETDSCAKLTSCIAGMFTHILTTHITRYTQQKTLMYYH